jgi:WD40 repeat protein
VVCDVSFSPDGRLLASASYDHSVLIWEGDACRPLIGHADAVHGVAFSPDGQRLASASQDQTVRLWDATTGEPLGQRESDLETLSDKLTANMSREEWRVWVSPDIDYLPASPDLPIPPD